MVNSDASLGFINHFSVKYKDKMKYFQVIQNIQVLIRHLITC